MFSPILRLIFLFIMISCSSVWLPWALRSKDIAHDSNCHLHLNIFSFDRIQSKLEHIHSTTTPASVDRASGNGSWNRTVNFRKTRAALKLQKNNKLLWCSKASHAGKPSNWTSKLTGLYLVEQLPSIVNLFFSRRHLNASGSQLTCWFWSRSFYRM